MTLVVPPLAVNSAAAYRAWDDLGAATADGPNDLEPAAIRVEPELARWRDRIGDACGESPVLAGSGATWWVPGEHSNALAELSDEGAEIVASADRPWRSRLRGGSSAVGLTGAICDAGDAYDEASSCASSCASACGAS